MSKDRFKQLFIEESLECLQQAEEDLLALEKDSGNKNILNSLFRTIHTIKGGAGMVNMPKIAELAHSMENTLSGIRQEGILIKSEELDILLSAADILKQLIEGEDECLPAVQAKYDIAIKALQGLEIIGGGSEEGAGEESFEIFEDANFVAEQTENGENQKEEGKVKRDVNRKNSSNQEQGDSIRVSSAKLESILDCVGELIITQSRLKEMAVRLKERDRFQGTEFATSFEEADKIIRRLQEEVMNASMIPIGGTFVRFQRMARDLAKDLGKEIELTISGKETELDKKIIEQIIDPLKHLVRNSVGHGIESPEERVTKGKPRRGTINLDAYHQEGNIIIEIGDDGRGIDEEAVLAKARERNLIAPDETPDQAAVRQLVFQPGFSTAKELSDVSGRGVGLDVVTTNIKNLSGTIELFSEEDKGTRFLIRLPLTLAIIDGMMIRTGKERFIVPLNTIIEFIKPLEGQVRQAEGKGKVLNLRGEVIPFIGLYQLFDLEADSLKDSDGIMVILKEGQKKIALLVDEIIGQEQVVIKSIREHMEQVEGIAGATIMGDGRVAVILDITSLFRLAKQYSNYSVALS